MICDTSNSFFAGDLYQTLSGHRDSSTSCAGLISFSAAPPSHYERDPGRIGFIDEIGGSVDGFLSCTESLGSESFDDRSADDRSSIEATNPTRKRSREGSPEERREVKTFPPPLTSLNRYGWPSFVLQPMRKDGRLELTEIKIHRPEILCASRENGRLTIHLVKYEDREEETDEAGLEEARSEVLNDVVVGEEEEEEEKEGWRLAVASDGGGGEGLRRCYHRHEGGGQNRHRHLDVWSPLCVSTR